MPVFQSLIIVVGFLMIGQGIAEGVWLLIGSAIVSALTFVLATGYVFGTRDVSALPEMNNNSLKLSAVTQLLRLAAAYQLFIVDQAFFAGMLALGAVAALLMLIYHFITPEASS